MRSSGHTIRILLILNVIDSILNVIILLIHRVISQILIIDTIILQNVALELSHGYHWQMCGLQLFTSRRFRLKNSLIFAKTRSLSDYRLLFSVLIAQLIWEHSEVLRLCHYVWLLIRVSIIDKMVISVHSSNFLLIWQTSSKLTRASQVQQTFRID